MKHKWRCTVLLAIACLLSVPGFARARTRTAVGEGAARLIVHRIPTMGKFVFVQLYIDNVAVGAIAYGGKYEGLLKPGRHLLSALAVPSPKWWERPPTIVDVRNGQTYEFTAIGNGQGNLILWDNRDKRASRVALLQRTSYRPTW